MAQEVVQNDRQDQKENGLSLPRVPALEAMTDQDKQIRLNGYSTFMGIIKGRTLKEDLEEHKSILKNDLDNAPSQEIGSLDYLKSHINLKKIQKSCPAIEIDLIVPEKLIEPLTQALLKKDYGKVKDLIKTIGNYTVPTDPRLTEQEIGLLNQVSSKPWFKAYSEVGQLRTLDYIFDLGSNANLSKESFLALLNNDTFNTLSASDQQRVIYLATSLGDETCNNLGKILDDKINGKCTLLNEDFTEENDQAGKTLLSNLVKFLQSDLATVEVDKEHINLNLEKDELLNSLIKEIAEFKDVAQENRGTCAPTVVHHFMSWMCPSELTRLYTDLLTNEMCATKGGSLVKLLADAVPDDNTGRSPCERIFTGSLLNDASNKISNGLVDYSNQKDGFTILNSNPFRKTGQTDAEFIHTCKSIFGNLSVIIDPKVGDRTRKIEDAIEILGTLDPETTNPRFIALAISWPTEIAEDGTILSSGSHAILARGIIPKEIRKGRTMVEVPPDKKRLVFRNPHGPSKKENGQYIDKENLIRVENSEEGDYSIPLSAIRKGGPFELGLFLKR